MKVVLLAALLIFAAAFLCLIYNDLKYKKMKIPFSDSLDPRMETVDLKKNPVKFWIYFILQCFTFLFMIYFLVRSLISD